MNEFIAIDFGTANPKRVSACALGYAKVADCEIIETIGYLIKPIGGHASFQSKIHGIKDEHTFDKPSFGELFQEIKDVFSYPLVGHSLFDKQVLKALSDHFNLGLEFNYLDSCGVAKEKLPDLRNHKLKTLNKHFNLPAFNHHDAAEDAIACANIFIKLSEYVTDEIIPAAENDMYEFKGILIGIMADNEVNYKEAYELLYWLEDHINISKHHQDLYSKTREVLEDDYLDQIEAREIKMLVGETLKCL